MIGAIIGDIVGSRFEFDNCRRTKFELFHPDSRFTDDTVCTMAVADWVVNVDRWDPSDSSRFAAMLQSWCRRYPLGDYGGMFRRWINNPVPYDSFGNGAGMRISPVADAFGVSNELFAAVDLVTAVSHDHPEGIKGASAVAMATAMAWAGASKHAIKREVIMNYGYDLGFTCGYIRKINYFDETCQVTVPQAIVAFLESTDFESAIRLAVSIGGDSDTIAAMTGSIAEAAYGVPDWMVYAAFEKLPTEMTNLVRKFYQSLSHERIPNHL